jgi:hypothetical protein
VILDRENAVQWAEEAGHWHAGEAAQRAKDAGHSEQLGRRV